jgi:ATP/maltotriose-dependent transcriptional regulator MalT
MALTARELEVLTLIAQGCTYSEAGRKLDVSPHTVQTHIKNIYNKLEVHSARAAIWRAVQLKLLALLPG